MATVFSKFKIAATAIRRYLEFFKLFISDVIDMFQIEVQMFSQMLVMIGQIVEK